jgi:hypothetical protein
MVQAFSLPVDRPNGLPFPGLRSHFGNHFLGSRRAIEPATVTT